VKQAKQKELEDVTVNEEFLGRRRPAILMPAQYRDPENQRQRDHPCDRNRNESELRLYNQGEQRGCDTDAVTHQYARGA
jgi:hypothetical protein